MEALESSGINVFSGEERDEILKKKKYFYFCKEMHAVP